MNIFCSWKHCHGSLPESMSLPNNSTFRNLYPCKSSPIQHQRSNHPLILLDAESTVDKYTNSLRQDIQQISVGLMLRLFLLYKCLSITRIQCLSVYKQLQALKSRLLHALHCHGLSDTLLQHLITIHTLDVYKLESVS